MTLSTGEKLKIRSMVYIAGEPIPFFWPMRSFIHHNPLHGLEHLPFGRAVERGAQLFHARGYLPRATYQQYLADGRVDRDALAERVAAFASQRAPIADIDLEQWLMTLLSDIEQPVVMPTASCDADDVAAVLAGEEVSSDVSSGIDAFKERLGAQLLSSRPVYESVDALYGTDVGAELDELVVKSCLDFFDEGQSVWAMPKRELGFFAAWRRIASRNFRLFLRGVHIRKRLENNDSPEDVIAYVMRQFGVPEAEWPAYFTRELSRLHGWAGFIRWRSSAGNYYWANKYPGDLVDLLAIRLILVLGLLEERSRRRLPKSVDAIRGAIETQPQETWLRHELYSGAVMPALAQRIETALLSGDEAQIEKVFAEYVPRKRAYDATRQVQRLRALAERVGDVGVLGRLSSSELGELIDALREFEQHEGLCWLRAMESRAMRELLDGVSFAPPVAREKRPFVQALFCIDTRSERIRRHLESVGDYQTFGTAGFFGVPVSFMELGKGSESHLCPVLLTPKNLVLEMTTQSTSGDQALSALEHALHGAKESVLTPFVTVEAVGLLFGFDMVGKTVAPQTYNRWRNRFHGNKPQTHLLLDKLSREQADSIVRAVQRAVIDKAVEHELGFEPERITDDLIRELRESALGNDSDIKRVAEMLDMDVVDTEAFVERLREGYRINPAYAQLQFERLGRIGFAIDEQVNFVVQALRSIGLTRDFSRFVLLVGHGSTSENNPYESALDCGACGGNHGLISARVLARMANKPEVRQRLKAEGIDIAADAWFVPALHNTTTDELTLHDLDLLPSTHLIYLDRLRNGLNAASRLCAQERLPSLQMRAEQMDPAAAYRGVQRNASDWSQVRPEWGLSRNAYFIVGRRGLTDQLSLDGRAFLHSYDYRVDPRRRLLENILTGPLVVGQWINMEHYFSTVDNERFGSGSKVFHNVAGRFGVMTGNLSDLRTGLPSQTVLDQGRPYHEPLRLITVIEAPFDHAVKAIESVVSVKQLVRNDWIRLMVIDPQAETINIYEDGEWLSRPQPPARERATNEESVAS